MSTILLSRSDVERLLDPAALLANLRAAFRAYSMERTVPAQRAPSALPAPALGSVMIVFPGLIPGVPAYTVKVHAKNPQRRPAIQGVLHLHDLETGRLLALMDSAYLTAVRTGITGALAADILARPDAGRVAIVGAGVQGELQLRGLALVRALQHVVVFDSDPERADAFARRLSGEMGVPIVARPSIEAAVDGADIIVMATWARRPFLFAGMVRPGAHITTLGPDEPGKCEVDAAVIRDSVFVCDDRDLAVRMGAIGGAGLDVEAIRAELGEVIAGRYPGRTRVDEVTIYGGVGLAFQDLAAAWQVYRRAEQAGEGRTIDLSL